MNTKPITEMVLDYKPCRNRNHWFDLIVWGVCSSCKHEFMPEKDAKVFDRLEEAKH